MKKLIIPVFIMIILIFTLSVSATEVQPEYVEPEVIITSDSVNDSVVWEIYYDALTDEYILKLDIEDFGIGIYDTANTEAIDGIRLNDTLVYSTKIPIDVTVANKIVVRTVYKDDFTGVLAQIADGSYDYVNLLKNPLGLLMAGYYVLSIIITICSLAGLIFGKNKKSKTASEIASAVDTRASEAFTALSTKVPEILQPFIQSIHNTQETLVEAIVLMNSKEPNSHLEALECLKKISISNIESTISKVESELSNSITKNAEHIKHNIDNLTKIAETAQEESANDSKDLPIL